MVASSLGSPGRLTGGLVEDEVDMTRQRPVVELVSAVVQRLEDLRIQQADKKIEGRVIIRDHGIEGTFPLA